MQYSNCFQAKKKNYQNLWIKYILLNLIPLFMVWLIIALLLNIVFLFISNLGELFLDYASGIWLVDCYKLTINWKNDNGVTICLHYVIVIIFFFDVLFLLSILVTGPSFMPILSLVLELRKFSFIGDWWNYTRLNFAQYLETGAS